MIVSSLRRAALFAVMAGAAACALEHPAAVLPDGAIDVDSATSDAGDSGSDAPDASRPDVVVIDADAVVIDVPAPDAPDDASFDATPDVTVDDAADVLDAATLDAPDAFDAAPDAFDARPDVSDAGLDVVVDVPRDASDASVDVTMGTTAFGGTCARDLECASGHCLTNGHCTRACSASALCPASTNWICGSNGLCACTVTSAVDSCNGIDDDCNGRIDDTATCASPLVCSTGACRCPAGRTTCGTRCLDLLTDVTSCGVCDRACPPGAVCTNGNCGCPTGQSICDGRCVDTTSDPNRCGSCTNRCPVACSAGACTTVSAIGAGSDYSCAILADTTVRCWGDNASGALGDGSGNNSGRPVAVSGLTGATQLSTGGVVDTAGTITGHACAVRSNGTIACWGSNGSGEIGNNTGSAAVIPSTVSGITTATRVAAGGAHTCAILVDRTLRCWGDNTHGQLGEPTTTPMRSTPGPALSLLAITDLSAGADHTCAVDSSGIVWCWGANDRMQLGDGTTHDSPAPRAVTLPGTRTALAVAAGASHTCVLASDMTVVCWGANTSGQVGSGTFADSIGPTVVTGLTSAAAIASGGAERDAGPYGLSCARLSDTTVRCWGAGASGQLGNSSTLTRPMPSAVTTLSAVATVRAGGLHACASLTDGRAVCWGNNLVGQLGNGTSMSSSQPVTVVW